MSEEKNKCPVTGNSSRQVAGSGTSNRDWWPRQLNLKILHQHSCKSNPMGTDFNYADEFKTLDLDGVKKRPGLVDDRFPGVVAGGLRPLWGTVYPDGMAQRRDLPHG